jgi:cold shock CspA family protein
MVNPGIVQMSTTAARIINTRPLSRTVQHRKKEGKRMPQGTVKFFNADKGCFISRRRRGVFVHYSNIDVAGYKSSKRSVVDFESAPGQAPRPSTFGSLSALTALRSG